MRIVVAEDEQRSRQGISRLIEAIDSSCTVVGQAVNGHDALEKIRRLRPDAVFTDIRMPGMTGLELVAACRAERLCPYFVIISAHAEFELARQAISLNVREYVVKPVTYDDVEGALERLKQLPQPEYAAKTESSCMHPAVARAMQEIAARYADRISLEAMAQELGMTPQYLSQIFRRDTGKNFSNYLQEYRMAKAKALFDEERLKVFECAERLGFGDVKYFCRVFKKCHGVAPSEYVKRT